MCPPGRRQVDGSRQQPAADGNSTAHSRAYTAQFTLNAAIWAAKTAKALGISLIVFGTIAFTCDIVHFSLKTGGFLGFAGPGFWGGMVLIITGIVATLAAVKCTNGLILAASIMSVLALLADFVLLGMTATELVTLHPNDHKYYSTSVTFGCVYLLIGICCFGVLSALSLVICRAMSCYSVTATFPVVVYASGAQSERSVSEAMMMAAREHMSRQDASPPPAYDMADPLPEKQ